MRIDEKVVRGPGLAGQSSRLPVDRKRSQRRTTAGEPTNIPF